MSVPDVGRSQPPHLCIVPEAEPSLVLRRLKFTELFSVPNMENVYVTVVVYHSV